jgi:hypothetical protein
MSSPAFLRSIACSHYRCCWLLLALVSLAVRAHDIPDEVVFQAFLKPQHERLDFVVRVPLVMLLNLNLPKRGPGFLDLERVGEGLEKAAVATAREIRLFENGELLQYAIFGARISQPSDRSFESFEAAAANIAGPPLLPEIGVFWNQGYFDVHYEYPIHSESADFAIDFQVAPGLRNRLKLILRFLPPDSEERTYHIHFDSGRVSLDPSWYQAAWTFVKLGCGHILDGADHLLFLLCLVAPFRLRHLRRLVVVVTAFTVAHSITLISAALGYVPKGIWFPPLVETLIAISILYMALENAVSAGLGHRWIVAGLFGLVHGLGFSFVLEQDLQLAGSHLLTSLLSFNIGVEIGQLLFVLAVVPIMAWLFATPRAERTASLVISVLVGHTAWHWMLERYGSIPW